MPARHAPSCDQGVDSTAPCTCGLDAERPRAVVMHVPFGDRDRQAMLELLDRVRGRVERGELRKVLVVEITRELSAAFDWSVGDPTLVETLGALALLHDQLIAEARARGRREAERGGPTS